MTRPEQVADELDAVRQLARHVPELRDRLCQAGSDPPDVTVEDIGIEVTELHRVRGTKPLIAIEKAQAQVTQAAFEVYRQRRGSPQHVKVSFHAKPLPHGLFREIAEHLASVVLDHVERPSPSLKLRGEELSSLLSPLIQWINMAQPGDGWDCIGGVSAERSWDAVMKMVRRKEIGLPSWPEGLMRRWLLIVAKATERVDRRDGRDPQKTILTSSVFLHAVIPSRPTLQTRFDRVYVLDVLTEEVARLA